LTIPLERVVDAWEGKLISFYNVKQLNYKACEFNIEPYIYGSEDAECNHESKTLSPKADDMPDPPKVVGRLNFNWKF
jgi:hypothetical protein